MRERGREDEYENAGVIIFLLCCRGNFPRRCTYMCIVIQLVFLHTAATVTCMFVFLMHV